MKRIYGFVLAAMATAVAASCSQKLNDDAADVNAGTSGLVSMTFNALNDAAEDIVSKTHGAGRNVYWDEGDEITVFSVGDEVIKQGFTATSITKNADGNGVQATFSGLVSPAAETFYAVCPHAEGNAYEDGTFTATIPAEQVGKPNGFLSGANVSVAVSHKDGENADVLQFKNLSAVIYFKFATAEDAANTKSVTLKARKSEDDASAPEFWGLAGEVKFTLDDDNLPVVQEGTVDHVTLLPPEGGFVTGQNYIIPVCPVGDCKGMQIIFTDLNGQTYVKNNNTDFKLQRNIMFNNAAVMNPYSAVLWPEEDFDVVLDFATWPFLEDIVALEKQKVTKYDDNLYEPQIYTFKATYDCPITGLERIRYVETAIALPVSSGSVDYYKYDDVNKALHFYAAKDATASIAWGANIMCPIISDRYVKSVKVEIVPMDDRTVMFRICEGFPSYGTNAYKQISSGATECLFEIPFTQNKNYVDTPLGVGTRTKNVKITKITFTYSKTKPE